MCNSLPRHYHRHAILLDKLLVHQVYSHLLVVFHKPPIITIAFLCDICLSADITSIRCASCGKQMFATLLCSGLDHISRIDRYLTTTNNNTWWSHQMETLSALLALCAGNSPITVEFSGQRLVTRSLVFFFFDLCLNKRLSKQSWGW